jgi:hypothetical protein
VRRGPTLNEQLAAVDSHGLFFFSVPRAGHHEGDSYGVKWGIEASPGVTSLNDDPYGWDLTQRWPKEAPLWMIYEAERDEIALPKPVERKERNRSKGRGLLRLPMRDETGRSMATGRRKTAVAQVVVRLVSCD